MFLRHPGRSRSSSYISCLLWVGPNLQLIYSTSFTNFKQCRTPGQELWYLSKIPLYLSRSNPGQTHFLNSSRWRTPHRVIQFLGMGIQTKQAMWCQSALQCTYPNENSSPSPSLPTLAMSIAVRCLQRFTCPGHFGVPKLEIQRGLQCKYASGFWMVWDDVWYLSIGCGWSCCEICFVPIAMLDDRRVLKLKVPGWCETHVRPAYVLAKAISYPPKKLPCIVWALYSASVPPRYLNGCAARKTIEMMKNCLEHVVGKLLAPLRSPLREYRSAQLTPPFTTGYQRISVLNQWRSPNFVAFLIFGLPALIGGCSTHTESYWIGNKQAETNHQPVDHSNRSIVPSYTTLP